MPRDHSDPAKVLDRAGIDTLIDHLRNAGFATRGPVVREGAIVPGDLGTILDLPIGVHDAQSPGSYRIESSDDAELFGWAVGPASLKGEFFPPRSTTWHGTLEGDGAVAVHGPGDEDGPVAYIGARPCEHAALAILDRVLSGGAHPDEQYRRRRNQSFVAIAECGTPSGTCFCHSMGSGPGVAEGFDLAITEISDPETARYLYLVRAGSEDGRSVLEALPGRPPLDADWDARASVLSGSREKMGAKIETDGLADLLGRNLDHPRWAEVAERCLACGNCTMVCPTCFCSDFDDVTDLTGGVERSRRWSSCFELSHSYIHGGSVRTSTASRYRQWATHKLSTWHDQFGTSGCVGCGRCIAWCPVGIDITEEVRAIRSTDGATLPVAPQGTRER